MSNDDPYESSNPLVASLKDLGVKVEEPCLIEHTFFCTDAKTLNKLFKALSKLGLELGAGSETEEDESIEEGSYTLICTEIARPDQMDDRGEELEEIAEKFDCEYDGWGRSV